MAFPSSSLSILKGIRAKSVLSTLPVLVAMLFAPTVKGQTSYYTASHPMRLQSFATFSHVTTDYGYKTSTSPVDYGISAGADLDFAAHMWVYPGLEIRATHATGDVSNLSSIGGGPRIVAPVGRFQPYAEFLVSEGRISFTHPNDPNYVKDTSKVYEYGGGVDVQMRPGWALKVDVLQQRWRLSKYQEPFYPMLVSVGVRYEVHGGKRSPR